MSQAAARSGKPAGRAARAAPARELRARGKLTRRRLLDAGAQAFAARGFYATRVDDIVKLAETSHGTFYLYFSNKEELFSALAAEVAEAMQEHAASMQPLAPDAEGRAALRAWIADLSQLYDQYGPVIRAWTEAEIGASEFGITTRTIRHYEDEGLLSPRREGQNRLFSPRDRVRLKLALRGKRLGFSLSEIRELFDLYDLARDEKRQLEQFLTKLEKRRALLVQQREDIEVMLNEIAFFEIQCRKLLAADLAKPAAPAQSAA